MPDEPSHRGRLLVRQIDLKAAVIQPPGLIPSQERLIRFRRWPTLTRRRRVDSCLTAGWFSASLVTSVSPSLATSASTSVSSSVLIPPSFSVFTSCLISLLTWQLWQMRRFLSVSRSCLTPRLPLRLLWVLGGVLSGLGSLKLSCSCWAWVTISLWFAPGYSARAEREMVGYTYLLHRHRFRQPLSNFAIAHVCDFFVNC